MSTVQTLPAQDAVIAESPSTTSSIEALALKLHKGIDQLVTQLNKKQTELDKWKSIAAEYKNNRSRVRVLPKKTAA